MCSSDLEFSSLSSYKKLLSEELSKNLAKIFIVQPSVNIHIIWKLYAAPLWCNKRELGGASKRKWCNERPLAEQFGPAFSEISSLYSHNPIFKSAVEHLK